jgi:cell division septation protein DedD
MMAYLFSLVLVWTLNGSETPNFYPSYPSAKDASRNHQKELLVFFTKKACSKCDSAWKAFEKDGIATHRFISTRLDAEDFDGGVFFEKYGFTSVPSWVILAADGSVIEKWEGGWKDGSGNPTLFVAEESGKKEMAVAPKPYTVPKNEPNPSTFGTNAVSTNSQPAPDAMASSKKVMTGEPSDMPSQPASKTSRPEMMQDGFVLQAGFFGSETNAQKLISDLKSKGMIEYSISSTRQNGTAFFRVISKAYASESEATKEMHSMAGAGIKVTMKKMSEL